MLAAATVLSAGAAVAAVVGPVPPPGATVAAGRRLRVLHPRGRHALHARVANGLAGGLGSDGPRPDGSRRPPAAPLNAAARLTPVVPLAPLVPGVRSARPTGTNRLFHPAFTALRALTAIHVLATVRALTALHVLATVRALTALRGLRMLRGLRGLRGLCVLRVLGVLGGVLVSDWRSPVTSPSAVRTARR
ncbi:hypothetical protein STENM223S_00186 [Streptomyces tendae]